MKVVENLIGDGIKIFLPFIFSFISFVNIYGAIKLILLGLVR